MPEQDNLDNVPEEPEEAPVQTPSEAPHLPGQQDRPVNC